MQQKADQVHSIRASAHDPKQCAMQRKRAPAAHGMSPFFHRRRLFCTTGGMRLRISVSRRSSTPGPSLGAWNHSQPPLTNRNSQSRQQAGRICATLTAVGLSSPSEVSSNSHSVRYASKRAMTAVPVTRHVWSPRRPDRRLRCPHKQLLFTFWCTRMHMFCLCITLALAEPGFHGPAEQVAGRLLAHRLLRSASAAARPPIRLCSVAQIATCCTKARLGTVGTTTLCCQATSTASAQEGK